MFSIDLFKSDEENLRDALREISRLTDVLINERARHIDVSCKHKELDSPCTYGDAGLCKGCEQKDTMRDLARVELIREGALKEACNS